MQNEEMVLCAANAYSQKYYFNPRYQALPEGIRQELQIMCVTYTEEVGGILTLTFSPDGRLLISAYGDDRDIYYDEVSSGLKIREMQMEKKTLFEGLEQYYRTFFLGEEYKA